MIDAHIHLDQIDPAQLEWVRSPPAGGYRAVVPGIGLEQLRAVLARWAEHPRLAICAGLHPWYLPPRANEDDAFATLETLARSPAVQAIGETGLDHYRFVDEAARAAVAYAFRRHLELAASLTKPVVIHCVRAHDECAKILRESAAIPTAMVHAFSGSPEQASAYRRLGAYVSIGSAVTNPRSKRVRRAAANVPADQLLIETDAPYMNTDSGPRDEGIPDNVQSVATEVARLRGIPLERLWDSVETNYDRFLRGEPPV